MSQAPSSSYDDMIGRRPTQSIGTCRGGPVVKLIHPRRAFTWPPFFLSVAHFHLLNSSDHIPYATMPPKVCLLAP